MKTGIIPMTQSGAILGRPGQYKSPPFLTLPGNPPLEEVTLYDFKVNEIPEPEDIDNIPEDEKKSRRIPITAILTRTPTGTTAFSGTGIRIVSRKRKPVLTQGTKAVTGQRKIHGKTLHGHWSK